MNKAPPKAPKPFKRELVRHAEIGERLDELKAEADALKREARKIEETAEAYLRHEAPEPLRLTLFGFELAVEQQKGGVRWKDAFIEHAGADEAARLSNEAEPREKFSIVRAG